jgi:predicted  nucleic acid-binding Zn-ribbon protein
MKFNSGVEPGKGMYSCEFCGSSVTLDNDSDILSSCLKCGKDEFNKGY